MQTITSVQNPLIKDIKALKVRKNREEKALYFIEGIRFVDEAVKEKADIVKVLVSDSFTSNRGGQELLGSIRKHGFEAYHLPDKLFQEISDTDNPQGILAVLRIKHNEECGFTEKGSFFIILDSLQDPGNLGTIIRTADAAGVDGIIMSKNCVDLYNPKVLRATMGSIFHVPVYTSANLTTSIKALKAQGTRVIAAHLDGRTDYFNVDMQQKLSIIIGNEANGISDEIAALADELVKIPMPGRSESLNASIAAALLMYEGVRQRSAFSRK